MNKIPKLILIGLGKVGREVIRQLETLRCNVEITGLADSSACLVSNPLTQEVRDKAIQHKVNGGRLSELPDSIDFEKLVDFYTQDTIIVDTSAARDLDWSIAIAKGCKLVFANKNALSTSWGRARLLYHQPGIRYEATVGAGLPIINTLQSLVESGDQITHIEGVMSGTLGYLCSQLQKGVSYSQAVRQAFEAGYTEPDPRDDLSGFDVLRKALILARTAGWPVEKEDFQVQAMVDEGLKAGSVTDFLQNMTQSDQGYADQVQKAAVQGKVLRYLATITPSGGRIGLQPVDLASQLGALQGTGNYFAIYSRLYQQIPLVIAGPGAGIEVTANGVLNDIIALLN